MTGANRITPRWAAAPAGVGLLVVVLLAPTPSAASSDGDAVGWQAVVAAYARDGDRASRRRVLALARDATEHLPPLALLVVADALVRGGRVAAAVPLLRAVLATDPPDPLRAWAHIGLGWAAIERRDLVGARAELAETARLDGGAGTFAFVMLGLLDAAAERTDSAADLFAQVAGHPSTLPEVRAAVRLAHGYARYWLGDDRGAEDAFIAVMADAPDGPLADDADYARARVLLRRGERRAAEEVLHTLAGTDGAGRAAESMLDVAPRGLLRAGSRRYRRLPLRPPEQQLVALLDEDGAALARATLRRLDGGPRVAPPEVPVLPPVSSGVGGEPERAVIDVAPSRASRTPGATRSEPSSWLRLAGLLALAVLVLYGARRRRRETPLAVGGASRRATSSASRMVRR